MAKIKEYRVVVEYEQEPDKSWLEQDEFADENPEDHIMHAMLIQIPCKCGTWRTINSLGNIDMLSDQTGVYSSVKEISDKYLRSAAREMLAEARRA